MNWSRQIRARMTFLEPPVGIRVLGVRAKWPLLCIVVLLLSLVAGFTWASDTAPPSASAASAKTAAQETPPEPEAHGISQKAVEIARLRNFPITNSMMVSWIVALGLIVFAQLATRK